MTESHEKEIDDAIERMTFWNQMDEDEYIEDEDDNTEWRQHIKDSNLLLSELKKVRQQLAEFTVKEGPLNAERWTLGHLMEVLENWKQIASDKTCISVENLCYGASSLWHQTHRENFRKVNAKPEALSRWVLANEGSVHDDFATQVLEILEKLKEDNLRFCLIDDRTPLTHEWLATVFPRQSINGYSIVIDAAEFCPFPLELFIREQPDSSGLFTATLKHDSNQIVIISGRQFHVRGDIQILLMALRCSQFYETSNGKSE